MGIMLVLGLVSAQAQTVRVGKGGYATELALGGEREPVASTYSNGPVPTNKWYSSLVFNQWPQPLYAQPASYRPHPDGFQIDLPVREAVMNGSREENDIVAAHRSTLVVKPEGITPRQAQLGKHSDWAIDILMPDGDKYFKATIAHGSPYSYFHTSAERVSFKASENVKEFYRSADQKTIGISIDNRNFAVFAPSGASWKAQGEDGFELTLPRGKDYFSVAVLPRADVAIVKEFAQYAYAFIVDTKVDWNFDEKRSELITRFAAKTDVMEGGEKGTLFALYPHQWFNNPVLKMALPYTYESIRGQLKLVAGTSFETRFAYHGTLPLWPALQGAAERSKLDLFIAEDSKFGAEHLLGNRGTYWEGKGLNRAVQLMNVAEQQGNLVLRDEILAALKKRLQTWFGPADTTEHYFYYNPKIGSLIGYPDEFGSAEQMNDHHFHYGYWIYASAQVALRDPVWASTGQWGAMVEMMIADIANTDAANNKFIRLRNFDPYEGHSWASGTVPFYDGNNQESSSEAINAWAGMILWGEATGNKRLRDAGIYLYTTEVEALKHYWFDLHHQVFDREYGNVEAAMVWGDKYVHTTWWTEDPREVHGINMLPITASSLYLGTDPDYIQRNLVAMDREFTKFIARDGKAPKDIWQDILLSYAALNNAKSALAQWNQNGPVEDGETRSHTYHWLVSLSEMGRPDFGVQADCVLYAVFKNSNGKRVYVAYNVQPKARTVHFSDGVQMLVPARSLKQMEKVLP
ncbi:glycosyl hydrolase [Uliginosibacterium gangwonense]|uniref:glycosyl hydrolase n=1 Tax=Uliginosibacterium gangwonense TaxID=392736 RepID=UPI0012FC70A5|nr:glycosyl hydrolase [Uliginosibacterium gangwonense]